MKLMSIGQVAKTAGVGIETVRFYEREGLLAEPLRKESGYRQFTQDVVERLRFIKRGKELGFSLKEIKELLALSVDPETTCADVRLRATAKMDEVEAKIHDLRRIRNALKKLTVACSGSGPISECPILEALEEKE